jgi:hypothetical protein
MTQLKPIHTYICVKNIVIYLYNNFFFFQINSSYVYRLGLYQLSFFIHFEGISYTRYVSFVIRTIIIKHSQVLNIIFFRKYLCDILVD